MSSSQPGSATAAAAAHAAEAVDGRSSVHGGAAPGTHGGAAPGQPATDPEEAAQQLYGGDGAQGGAVDGSAAASVDAAHDHAAAGAYGQEWAADGASATHAAAEGGAAAEPPAYSPAEYLLQLEAHLAGLQAQRRDVQQQLVAAAAAGYQAASQRLAGSSSGVRLPSEPDALVGELAVLQSLRQYLAYVQELQALVRHVDKSARLLQQQAAATQQEGGGGDAFVRSVSETVDGFSSAVGYAVAVRQLADEGKVPSERLQRYAAGLLGRADALQGSLRAVLSAAIQQRLAAAHWPPPLAVSGEGAAAAADDGAWRGFGAAGEAAAGELQRLLVVLLTLQRASQHEAFSTLTEASQQGPLLWIAEELAAPLAQRLRHHFAGGLPTDRPDRPEWLFATALKAAQQCSPLAQELQPCIEAHGLQSWYSLPLEVARAVEAVGVNAVLGEHLLPQLVEAADPALWLHLADEAMQFERRFAPLRGASLALPDDEEFLAAAHPGSAIELLFAQPQWEEGWLGAELLDASRQLDAACDAYAAWQPAAQQLLAAAGDEPDLAPDTPRGSGSAAAWRREFWPPVCAEQVASLVGGLVRRGGWVACREHKLRYMQAVPLAVLRAYRDRLTGLLQQAEQFRGMLGDTWLPRVGAAVCAAHHLEHWLSEPQGVALLVELQESAGTAGTIGTAGTAPAAGGRGLAALVGREAAAFGALRRQWSYRLAKQAVDAFHALLTPYKRDAAAFAAGYEEGATPDEAAAAAAAAGPAAPSPAMLLAADSLQQLLRAMAQVLDAVAFRDVWKSVALAVNYSLYNDVATEALFSPQGAAQLDADLATMTAVFGEYTSRPAAHFKESREACRLLALPHAEAAPLLGQLTAQPRAAKALLAPHGVKALNAEQAAAVLMQRLDVLTAASRGAAVGPSAPGAAAVQPGAVAV